MSEAPKPDSIDPLLVAAVGLTALTCLLAFLVWGESYEWQLADLSTYQVFPIFGLLAFSIMWSQYVIEATKNYFGRTEAIPKYFAVSGWLVLIAIIFHPGLLIFQRFRDGYGLPPGSYETYVAPAQKWIALLGSVSLLIFFCFELKRWYRHKPWWKYVLILNDIAILAIFFHGLRLGQQLQSGWYQAVWYFYGLVLILALGYKYYLKLQTRQKSAR